MKKLSVLLAAVAISAVAHVVSAETWCMPGTYQGWKLETNHFEAVGDGTYTMTIPDLYGEFKIVKYVDVPNWGNEWGTNGSSIENGVAYYAAKGGNNIDLAGDNRHYINAKVTITPGQSENDNVTILIEAERIDDVWCMPGAYQSPDQWSLEANHFTAVGNGSYTLSLPELYGDIKIVRLNEAGNWDNQWGTNGGLIVNGDTYYAVKGGNNITLAGDNFHYKNVTVTITPGEYDALAILIEADETWHLVGADPLAWSFIDAPMFEKSNDNVWTLAYTGTITGEFKVVKNTAWSKSYTTEGAVELDNDYTISSPKDPSGNMSPANGSWENPTFTLVDNGDAGIDLTVTIKDPSGVEAIGADTAKGEAVYFNLQGQRVANPENGLYIRIREGKATKVTL